MNMYIYSIYMYMHWMCNVVACMPVLCITPHMSVKANLYRKHHRHEVSDCVCACVEMYICWLSHSMQHQRMCRAVCECSHVAVCECSVTVALLSQIIMQSV